jgi:hypothetical protein
LGKQSFDRITDYADDFLRYLGKLDPYFPAHQQRAFFRAAAYSVFAGIKHDIKQDIRRKQKTPGAKPGEIAARIASESCDFVLEKKALPCVEEEFPSRLVAEYDEQLREAYDASLKEYELATQIAERLRHTAAHYIAACPRPNWRSGLVFAGFGESQIFPAIRTISCNLVVLNRVICADEPNETDEIGFENEASLMPFAQRDVVMTFLEGIKPDYREMLDAAISTVFDGLPTVILEKLGDVDEAKRLEIAAAVKNNAIRAKDEFFNRLTQEIQKGEIKPLLDVIEAMPKDELAQMAEALVNLTSVKRKMSHDLETVGGPIDVAVISKGDGFIWMSRKHYFKPELNVHFTRTYFER